MTRSLFFLAVVSGLFPLWAGGTAGAQPFRWQKATPESQGISARKLDALNTDLMKRRTRAFLVIRNDKIVHERYARGFGPEKPHYTASLAKAVVAGLSFGVAVSDGRVHIDDPAMTYVPHWRQDPKKSTITLRHLGSHTSGLSDATTQREMNGRPPPWVKAFWDRLPPPNDPFTISRDKAPLIFEPGTRFHYSNPGIGMLTYCVTAALRDGPEKDIRTLLKNRVMRPIGVADAQWSAGYAETFTVDGLPLVGSWGGGNFTPRAIARIGRLVLNEGDWNGTRILSPEALRQMTGDAGLPGRCAMGWWTNAAGQYPNLPRDAVWGEGAGDQLLLVVPSLDLIVVRNGEKLLTAAEPRPRKPGPLPEATHNPGMQALFDPLMEAIRVGPEASDTLPVPPSPVISGISWAPKETIVRLAKGSDNWPLTWGDDDRLYTAYGDGWGFEPFSREKLSLGFARIEGGPDDVKGVNLSAPTGERKGDGQHGKKASGILMVDGVLYLWVRNAGNAQLAWSPDRGNTWRWSEWKFAESFGAPTFLNFGKNYSGARDGFVYIYSHDHESAYHAADRMVLCRVPKEKISKREAYEFFKTLDPENRPVWRKDIAERGPVFSNRGKCWRSGISYNAALGRYLWCQTLPGKDPRFQGGFGIYDAPEPWGPWSTVFHTDSWDVGPGESGHFPTKWMSADGKGLYLVFSGDDAFSVRKATLTASGGQ